MATITATYYIDIDFDLEDYDIDPQDVEEFYIKYATLYVKLKGKEDFIECDPISDPYEFDFKRADEVNQDF